MLPPSARQIALWQPGFLASFKSRDCEAYMRSHVEPFFPATNPNTAVERFAVNSYIRRMPSSKGRPFFQYTRGFRVTFDVLFSA